jgi:hypothetical protein
MTKEQCASERNDKEMILHPEWWPLGSYLPVKKRDPFPEQNTGIIVDGHPTIVLIGTIGLTDFGKSPTKSYESVDALLADGWLVD